MCAHARDISAGDFRLECAQSGIGLRAGGIKPVLCVSRAWGFASTVRGSGVTHHSWIYRQVEVDYRKGLWLA
jgi:hypothetical protein